MIVLLRKYCSNQHLLSAAAYDAAKMTHDEALALRREFEVAIVGEGDRICDQCGSYRFTFDQYETPYETMEEAHLFLAQFARDQIAQMSDPILAAIATHIYEAQLGTL